MNARTLMGWCLAWALMLFPVASVAVAADAAPLGTWRIEVLLPDGGGLGMIFNLEEKDGELAGTLMGEDGSENEAQDIQYKDGELTFKMVADFGGQELKSSFKGDVKGDEFSGTVDYEIGGDGGTLDVTGTREKAIVLGGTWVLVASTDQGLFEPKMHLKHEGDAISGVYVWVDETEIEIDEAKLKDDKLTFTVRHDFGGQELIVKFDVKVDGDTLQGAADYDQDGQTGRAEVDGARLPSVAGTWNIAITGPGSELIEASVVLEQDGESLTGNYSGPAGEAKVANGGLDGKTISFSVTREQGGQSLVLKYKGEVQGDQIIGTVDFDYDGDAQTLAFEATRD